MKSPARFLLPSTIALTLASPAAGHGDPIALGLLFQHCLTNEGMSEREMLEKLDVCAASFVKANLPTCAGAADEASTKAALEAARASCQSLHQRVCPNTSLASREALIGCFVVDADATDRKVASPACMTAVARLESTTRCAVARTLR